MTNSHPALPTRLRSTTTQQAEIDLVWNFDDQTGGYWSVLDRHFIIEASADGLVSTYLRNSTGGRREPGLHHADTLRVALAELGWEAF